MHGLWPGTMFVLSKNVWILHIAYCMGLEWVICIMRCYYNRVVMGKKWAVIMSSSEILQFFDTLPASPFMPVEQVQKPQDKPAPYAHKPGPKGKHAKDRPKPQPKCSNKAQRLLRCARFNCKNTLNTQQLLSTVVQAVLQCNGILELHNS